MVSIGTDFFLPAMPRQRPIDLDKEADAWLGLGNFRFGGEVDGEDLPKQWHEWSDRDREWIPISYETALARLQLYLRGRYGRALKSDVEELLFAAQCGCENYNYRAIDARTANQPSG